MQRSKVRGPSPGRRKNAPPQGSEQQQRLTLTLSDKDMEALQQIADENLRSMSAQALFYIRTSLQRELRAKAENPDG